MNHTIPTGLQRVFIGIPVDKHSQKHIDSLLKPIKNLSQDIRWIPGNNRHLTLAFLGDKPISEIELLLRQFDETYRYEARFQYSLSTLTRFPNSRGRIIALAGALTGPLDNLFQITRRLLQINDFEFDQKKFRPHITLARIRHPKRLKTTFDQSIDIRLDITNVTLYQSTLTENGSIYSPLKKTCLKR